MNRRPITTSTALLSIALAASFALAACDTGDGKQLKSFDPADYPSQTSPPTTVEGSEGFDAFDPVDDAGVVPTVDEPTPGEAAQFQVFAPWANGGEIDPRNTCDGDDLAPALSWGAVPEGTVEIAISLVDESAVSNGQPFVHWVITGLDPNEIALVEGDVPEGARQALNYFGDVGYGGPCPPPGGDSHLYRLTAYALNKSLEVADGSLANEFLDAIAPATLRSADLSGTYQR
ncbi:MAG: YbhB/YbcL family Raf kinase inhibitor-like protein [Ilumatobacteraceae bacterium]